MPPISPRPPLLVCAVGKRGISQSRNAWLERVCSHTSPRPENSHTSPSPLINAVQILPLVAYSVPMPAQLLFGLIPSYWPMKMVWQAADGLPYAPYLVAGLAVNLVAVGLSVHRFERIAHR